MRNIFRIIKDLSCIYYNKYLAKDLELAPPILPTITHELRVCRITSGEDLNQISKSLNIASHYLKAIEQGDLNALPQHPYILGFVRSYAKYLKLDASQVARKYKIEVLKDSSKISYNLPIPISSNVLPKRTTIYITTTLFSIGVIYGWYYFYLNTNCSYLIKFKEQSYFHIYKAKEDAQSSKELTSEPSNALIAYSPLNKDFEY